MSQGLIRALTRHNGKQKHQWRCAQCKALLILPGKGGLVPSRCPRCGGGYLYRLTGEAKRLVTKGTTTK